jgi:hypothetical protein
LGLNQSIVVFGAGAQTSIAPNNIRFVCVYNFVKFRKSLFLKEKTTDQQYSKPEHMTACISSGKSLLVTFDCCNEPDDAQNNVTA